MKLKLQGGDSTGSAKSGTPAYEKIILIISF
jgi:hypothetical protein